jgi:hypothetical protein
MLNVISSTPFYHNESSYILHAITPSRLITMPSNESSSHQFTVHHSATATVPCFTFFLENPQFSSRVPTT